MGNSRHHRRRLIKRIACCVQYINEMQIKKLAWRPDMLLCVQFVRTLNCSQIQLWVLSVWAIQYSHNINNETLYLVFFCFNYYYYCDFICFRFTHIPFHPTAADISGVPFENNFPKSSMAADVQSSIFV